MNVRFGTGTRRTTREEVQITVSQETRVIFGIFFPNSKELDI